MNSPAVFARQRDITVLFLLCATLVMQAWSLEAVQGQQDSKPAQNSEATRQTFSTQTELVLVPAVVRDKKDAHVSGLSKDDFIVQENGAEQKIAIFEEVRSSGSPVHRLSQPGIYSNLLQSATGGPPRLNIVVLDTINTPFLDQSRARRQLVDYLSKSVERGELTALLTLSRSGIKVVHDFTTDTGILIRALQRVRGDSHMMQGENTDALASDADTGDATAVAAETNDIEDFLSAMESQMARLQQQFAIQYTIDGFESIARAFGGIPGRKSLIWVTGSFPFMIDKPGDPPSSRTFQPELSHAFQLMNDANIAIYPVDARGLVVALPDASTRMRINPRNPGQLTRARLDSHADTITTMQSFAEMTGGRAFYNTNDLERAFQRAADDSSSYYLLGYYRNAADDKPGWRKLHVKVKRGGTNVRARSGYFVYAKNRGPAPPSDMQQALRSPLDFTGVPLAVRWEAADQQASGAHGGGTNESASNASSAPAASSAGKKKVVFELGVNPNGLEVDSADQNHVSFQVLALARKPTGETAAQTSQTVDGHLKPETLAKIQSTGLTYRNQLEIEPGEYTVRFVVRDNLSGKIGTVSAPLEVK